MTTATLGIDLASAAFMELLEQTARGRKKAWRLARKISSVATVWALAVWRSANEEPGERPQRLAA